MVIVAANQILAPPSGAHPSAREVYETSQSREQRRYPNRPTTIRYDTRCYINVRSKANMSQLNLPHGTDN